MLLFDVFKMFTFGIYVTVGNPEPLRIQVESLVLSTKPPSHTGQLVIFEKQEIPSRL